MSTIRVKKKISFNNLLNNFASQWLYYFMKKKYINSFRLNSLVFNGENSKNHSASFLLLNNQNKSLTNVSSNFKDKMLSSKKIIPVLFSIKVEKTEKFWNSTFDKGRLKSFISWFLKNYGERKTIELLEQLKKLGFGYATQAGVSLGIDDLLIPPQKMNFLYSSNKMVSKSNTKYKNAKITAVEKSQLFIDTWNETSENLKKEVVRYFEKTNIFNPVYMMAFSGARGNISQVRQLVGMRGLMSDPQGNIIDFPIQSNFREGLTLTEYIISTYGARKGIVDTALRTATAGYLTRRLVDVAQHVMISLFDCKTIRGIFVFDMKEGNQTLYSFQNRLIGRILANDVKITNVRPPKSDNFINSDSSINSENNKIDKSFVLGFRNQEISTELATKIAQLTKKAFVRSPLTCQSSKFVCQLCYGWSLSSNKLVSLGEAVGVIAAQSIGEPGTQLTMRTFHTGGVFAGGMTESVIANYNGWIEYLEPIPGTCVRTLQGKIAFLTKAESSFVLKKVSGSHLDNLETENLRFHNFERDFCYAKIAHPNKQKDLKSVELSFHKIPGYALLFVRHQESIFQKQIIAQFSSDTKQFKTQKGNAEQTVYADFEGEIFFNQIDLLEQKNNFFMQDNLWKTYYKSKIWILSGKIYQNPFLGSQNFFIQKQDFVDQNSICERISWYNPHSQIIEFGFGFNRLKLINRQFNNKKQSILLNGNKLKQSKAYFHLRAQTFTLKYSKNKSSIFHNYAPFKKAWSNNRNKLGERNTLKERSFQQNFMPINKFYLKKFSCIQPHRTSHFWIQRYNNKKNKRFFILFYKNKWSAERPTKFLFSSSTKLKRKFFQISKHFYKDRKKYFMFEKNRAICPKTTKELLTYNKSKLKFQIKDFSILKSLSLRTNKKKWFPFLIQRQAIQNLQMLKNSLYSREILKRKIPYDYYYNNRFRSVFKQKYNLKDFSSAKRTPRNQNFKEGTYINSKLKKNFSIGTKTSNVIFNYLNHLNTQRTTNNKQKKIQIITNSNNQTKFLPYFFKKNNLRNFLKKPVYISKIFMKIINNKDKKTLDLAFQAALKNRFSAQNYINRKESSKKQSQIESQLHSLLHSHRNVYKNPKNNLKTQTAPIIIQFSRFLNNVHSLKRFNTEKYVYIYEKKSYFDKKWILPLSTFSSTYFLPMFAEHSLHAKQSQKWRSKLKNRQRNDLGAFHTWDFSISNASLNGTGTKKNLHITTVTSVDARRSPVTFLQQGYVSPSQKSSNNKVVWAKKQPNFKEVSNKRNLFQLQPLNLNSINRQFWFSSNNNEHNQLNGLIIKKSFRKKTYLLKNKTLTFRNNSKKKVLYQKEILQKYNKTKKVFSIFPFENNIKINSFKFNLKRRKIDKVLPDKTFLKTPVLSVGLRKISFNSLGYIFHFKKFHSIKEKSKFIFLHKRNFKQNSSSLADLYKIYKRKGIWSINKVTRSRASKVNFSLDLGNKTLIPNSKNSFESDEIFSFLPLNPFYLNKNQTNQKSGDGVKYAKSKFSNSVSVLNNENIRPNPVRLFDWFSSDFKTNSGLFIWSKIKPKWNLQNDFWIQKKRFSNIFAIDPHFLGSKNPQKYAFSFKFIKQEHSNKRENVGPIPEYPPTGGVREGMNRIAKFHRNFDFPFQQKYLTNSCIISNNKVLQIFNTLKKNISNKNTLLNDFCLCSLNYSGGPSYYNSKSCSSSKLYNGYFLTTRGSLNDRRMILLNSLNFFYFIKNFKKNKSEANIIKKTVFKFPKNFYSKFYNDKQKKISNKRVLVTKKQIKILNQRNSFSANKIKRSKNAKKWKSTKFFEQTFLIKKFSVSKQKFSWIEQENYKFLNITTNFENKIHRTSPFVLFDKTKHLTQPMGYVKNDTLQKQGQKFPSSLNTHQAITPFYLVNRQGKKKYLSFRRSGLTIFSEHSFPYTKFKLSDVKILPGFKETNPNKFVNTKNSRRFEKTLTSKIFSKDSQKVFFISSTLLKSDQTGVHNFLRSKKYALENFYFSSKLTKRNNLKQFQVLNNNANKKQMETMKIKGRWNQKFPFFILDSELKNVLFKNLKKKFSSRAQSAPLLGSEKIFSSFERDFCYAKIAHQKTNFDFADISHCHNITSKSEKFLLQKKRKHKIAKPLKILVNKQEFIKPVFAQPRKDLTFFTSFPYYKKSHLYKIKKKEISPLNSYIFTMENLKKTHKKNKEKQSSFYLKNFHMSIKPGWIYVLTLKKSEANKTSEMNGLNKNYNNKEKIFLNFHQLYNSSGKMIISDMNFEQNSIYIENCTSNISKRVHLDSFQQELNLKTGKNNCYCERRTFNKATTEYFQNKNARYQITGKLSGVPLFDEHKVQTEQSQKICTLALLIRPIDLKILPTNYDLKNSFYEISKNSEIRQKSSQDFMKDYHSNLLNKQFSEQKSFISSSPSFDFHFQRISPLRNLQKKFLWNNRKKLEENPLLFSNSLNNKFEKKKQNNPFYSKTALKSQKKIFHRKKRVNRFRDRSAILKGYGKNSLAYPYGVSNFLTSIKQKKLFKYFLQKYLLFTVMDRKKTHYNKFFNFQFKQFIQKSIIKNFHTYYSYEKIFYNSFESNWRNPNFNNVFSNFPVPIIQINSKLSQFKSSELNGKNTASSHTPTGYGNFLKLLCQKSKNRSNLADFCRQKSANSSQFLRSQREYKNRANYLKIAQDYKRNNFFYKTNKKKPIHFCIQSLYALPYFKWSFVTKTAYLGTQRFFSSFNSSETLDQKGALGAQKMFLRNKNNSINRVSSFYKNSFLVYKSNFMFKNSKIANTDIFSPFQGELIRSNFQKNSWWNNFSDHFLVEKQRKKSYQIFLTKKDIFSIFFPTIETFEKFQFKNNPLKKRIFNDLQKLKSQFHLNLQPKTLQPKILQFNKETILIENTFDFSKFESRISYICQQKSANRKFLPKIWRTNTKNGGVPFFATKMNVFEIETLKKFHKIPEKQKKYSFYLKKIYKQNISLLNNFETLNKNDDCKIPYFFKEENYKVKKFLTKYKKRFYKLKGLNIGKPNKLSKIRLGHFLFKGDFIHSLTSFHKTGQILHFNSNKITFRHAQPFLISAKGILHVHQGDPIFQNLPIITLPFDTFTTGDIVQGIPKVEQYLEARTTQNGRVFLYSLPVLLQGIFRRYCTKFPLDQAVSQSFLKIQLIIVDGVQRVYRSQGVSISDKHLEVIVKQMTSKIRILHGGQTGFFPGELVDLEIIERINSFLMVKIQYEPVVLGITRASLEVESFLSAASFQQTTKILAKASLYKKKDFLKGLKENILIGNLIPAGTGYINII